MNLSIKKIKSIIINKKIIKIFLFLFISIYIIYRVLYYLFEKYIYKTLNGIYLQVINNINKNNNSDKKTLFLYNAIQNVPFYNMYFKNKNIKNITLKDFPVLKKSDLSKLNEEYLMINKNSKLLYESNNYLSTNWTELPKKQEIGMLKTIYFLYKIIHDNYAVSNCTGGSSGNYFNQWMNFDDIKGGLYTFMRCWVNMGWTIKDRFYLYYFHSSNNSNMTQKFVFDYFKSNSAILDEKNDITDDSVIQFIKDINTFQPKLIVSYPNIIFRICQKIFINKNNPKYTLTYFPKCMDLSADMLYTCQYNFIKTFFPNCDIRLSYGTIEFGQIAQQIPNSNSIFDYIVFNDVAYVENTNENQLIVTNYLYNTLPMIRYQIDDYGEVFYKNNEIIIKNLIGKNNKFNINYIELDNYINNCKYEGINNVRFDNNYNIFLTIINNKYKNEIHKYMSQFNPKYKINIIECIEDCFTFDSYYKKVTTFINDYNIKK